MTENNLIVSRNIDSNGNEVSIPIEKEPHTVFTNGTIQLIQCPDTFHGVSITDSGKNTYTQVFNLDEVEDNISNYYINFPQGIIHFNEAKIGQKIYANYYGIGYFNIDASRVTYMDEGDNIVYSIKQLVDKGYNAIQVLTKVSGIEDIKNQLNELIDKGETSVNQAEITMESLNKAIEDGDITQIHKDIDDITTKQNDTQTQVNSLSATFFKYLNISNCIIDLYGDSITAGQGATGHVVDGQMIFEKGDEIYKEGCTTCDCWANLLRRWLAKKYPNIKFTNRGIGGKTVVWSNQNKEYLVKSGDIAFIQLGTNDRWYTKPTDFKTNLKEFVEYVKGKYKLVIVMSATPCKNDDSTAITGKPAIFKSDDVDRLVTEVCQENRYYHISNYRSVYSYCERKGLNFRDLFESSGSHPLDLGHKYIWDNIKKNLGINDEETVDSRLTYNAFQTVAVERYIKDYNYGMTIENGLFTPYTPEKRGTKITFKSEDKLFGFQMFKSYDSSEKFWIRDATNYDTWGDWTRYIADNKQYQDRQYEIEVSIEKLPVGYTAVKVTSPKGIDSTTHILQVLPISTLEKNIVFSYTSVENSTTVYVRFYNMGTTEVTVPNGKFKVLLNFIGKTN